MGENSLLRRAEPDDAFELAKLQLRCWRETYSDLLSESFFEQQTVDDRLAMWSELLTGPYADRHWVAEDMGRLVGFAGSVPPVPGRSPQTQLWGLYLLSAYHGSGLGQKLLDATIGDERATLWVAEDNPRAQAFYRRNGFNPNGMIGILEDWEGITEIQMVRGQV